MYAKERWDMVNKQLRVRGVSDERVLQSMNSVPRHLFVPSHLVSQAYDDNPLPIGNSQTISQPYIVATMAESALIRSTDKVLEIGTGCGYSAAVLSTLANKVITCEIIEELGNSAKQRLANLKYDNVEVLVEDGSMGFKSNSPFDVIIVTAGAPTIPIELLYQLNLGGRMIIPVCYTKIHCGSKHQGERLVRLTRMKTENETESFQEEHLEDVRFVPLRGKAGWDAVSSISLGEL